MLNCETVVLLVSPLIFLAVTVKFLQFLFPLAGFTQKLLDQVVSTGFSLYDSFFFLH